MDAIDLLETIEEETGPDPRWSVLWLHGLGADGHDFVPLVPELVRPNWPSMRFVFPHAPVRAVTINVNYRYAEKELRYLFENSDMVALVTERQFADKVATVRPDTPQLQHVLVIDDGSTGEYEGADFESAIYVNGRT